RSRALRAVGGAEYRAFAAGDAWHRGRRGAACAGAVQPGRRRRNATDGIAAVPADALVVPVVAVASSPPQAASRSLRSGWGWTVAAGVVLLVGLGLRMALGGGGVGDRSALVMTVLLGGVAWLAARLFGGPRAALAAVAAVVLLVDLAALPPRNR